MTLKWTLKYPFDKAPISNEDLAFQVMRVQFGLKDSEYQVKEDSIEATPSLLTIPWVASIYRMTIYDFVLYPRRDENTIWVTVRLYKLYAIVLGFGILLFLTGFPRLGILIGIPLMWIFFASAAVSTLYIDVLILRKKFKSLA